MTMLTEEETKIFGELLTKFSLEKQAIRVPTGLADKKFCHYVQSGGWSFLDLKNHEYVLQPYMLVRVQKVFLFGDLEDAEVESMRVGMDDYLCGPGTFPATFFSPGAEGNDALTLRTCQVGQTVTIRFRLKADMPIRIRAVIFGLSVDEYARVEPIDRSNKFSATSPE